MIATLYEILKAMQSNFLANGWGGFYALGQKRVNGDDGSVRIVIPKEGNDFIDIAPTDNKGNYVYIRMLNETVGHSAKKLGSCLNIQQSFTLRAVGIWCDNSVSDYSLCDKLFADLAHFAQINPFGNLNLIITPQATLLNANDVFLDELGVGMQQRNLAITAIDFSMQFNLSNCNQKPEKCPVDVAPIVC